MVDRKKRLGQVSLESAFAFIIAVLLLLGATYIFVWMNKSIAERQRHFNNLVEAGYYNYKPEKLSIFKK